ncbi:hypothetical protein N657DRAFT_631995 [Parathielavia appendiculata]|uniref:Protein HRI1 n=1 Tax=Parathielavia appendiculata TaxID=2587402 RepID=A0AAN6U3P2_9PEZI|nr:hypothetical protein N657DRAFT_631995 [Parathielavia appendiculata]
MCDISIREYIRWLPGEASEPTSTIVLTTPQRRFVDVRVLKLTSEDASKTILPLSRLDWAIAGVSSLSAIQSPEDPGQKIKHCRWDHWIDSRTANTDGVFDEGDMFDDPSDASLTLEKGRMVNPATGVETDYEELWRSEPIETVPVPGAGKAEEITCLALQMEASGGGEGSVGRVRRGLVVRLGQYCQAFTRDGDDITVERLKWDTGQQRWTTEVRIGEQELPTEIATYLAHEARIDDEVKVGGAAWKVVERA